MGAGEEVSTAIVLSLKVVCWADGDEAERQKQRPAKHLGNYIFAKSLAAIDGVAGAL